MFVEEFQSLWAISQLPKLQFEKPLEHTIHEWYDKCIFHSSIQNHFKNAAEWLFSFKWIDRIAKILIILGPFLKSLLNISSNWDQYCSSLVKLSRKLWERFVIFWFWAPAEKLRALELENSQSLIWKVKETGIEVCK